MKYKTHSWKQKVDPALDIKIYVHFFNDVAAIKWDGYIYLIPLLLLNPLGIES